MKISVIFPAFNEEGSVQETIRRSLDALQPLFDEFEIVIVDDASVDQTGKLADALALMYPEIRVIHNPHNMGQGMSLRVGFQHARYPLVIHNAMDYPFDLHDLGKMLPLLEDADIVVAARKQRSGYTVYRKIASAVNLTLLNFLFRLNLHDYNFVQLYKKEVLDTVPVQARSTAFLTPETLIRAHDMGYRIGEVIIDYHPRQKGVATSGSPVVVIGSIYDMLRFWVERTWTSWNS